LGKGTPHFGKGKGKGKGKEPANSVRPIKKVNDFAS
jgi:hypothetical protein